METNMTLRLIPLLVAMTMMTGCVVYERDGAGNGSSDGWTNGGRPGGNTQDTATDPGTGTAAPAYTLTVTPGGAVPGQTTIVSIVAQGDIDLTQIVSVQFYGQSDVQVLATSSRNSSEYLMTLSIPGNAALGDNDMLVQMQDGTAIYVKLAFVVVSDPSQIPNDGNPNAAGGC
jgi:hypothetical protein